MNLLQRTAWSRRLQERFAHRSSGRAGRHAAGDEGQASGAVCGARPCGVVLSVAAGTTLAVTDLDAGSLGAGVEVNVDGTRGSLTC